MEELLLDSFQIVETFLTHINIVNVSTSRTCLNRLPRCTRQRMLKQINIKIWTKYFRINFCQIHIIIRGSYCQKNVQDIALSESSFCDGYIVTVAILLLLMLPTTATETSYFRNKNINRDLWISTTFAIQLNKTKRKEYSSSRRHILPVSSEL